MSLTRHEYITACLAAIDAPAGTEQLVAMSARIVQEWGGSSGEGPTFNALDLTESAEGATPFNTFGPNDSYHVWNYPDLATGADAFKRIIGQSEYAEVVNLLKSESAHADTIIEAWNKTPWGQCAPILVTQVRNNLSMYLGLLVNTGDAPEPVPSPAPAPQPTEEVPQMHTATYSHGGKYAVFGSRKMPLENADQDATFTAANPTASPVSLTDAQLDSMATVPWGQL